MAAYPTSIQTRTHMNLSDQNNSFLGEGNFHIDERLASTPRRQNRTHESNSDLRANIPWNLFSNLSHLSTSSPPPSFTPPSESSGHDSFEPTRTALDLRVTLRKESDSALPAHGDRVSQHRFSIHNLLEPKSDHPHVTNPTCHTISPDQSLFNSMYQLFLSIVNNQTTNLSNQQANQNNHFSFVNESNRTDTTLIGTKSCSPTRHCKFDPPAMKNSAVDQLIQSSTSGQRFPTSLDSFDSKYASKGPLMFYHPEPADSKLRIRAMIDRKDPRLRYVNDGAAIRNPFAVDRKEQLIHLTKLLCVQMEDGRYLCKGCDRITTRLRPMQQHLLAHSSSKFNLCVKCLKGFNDKYDMKRHTRKHTLVRPYVCSDCNRAFSQRCSLEGHRRKIHNIYYNYGRNERREIVRVCENCGFSCSHPSGMLEHTLAHHPHSSSLPRLQRQLIRYQDRLQRMVDKNRRKQPNIST